MTTHEPWNEPRAREIIAEHLHLEGPALPVLHALQETFGHVPAEAVPLVARALNISRADAHGIVTFYHDFRRAPAGRHVLRLCRAEACQSMGAEAIIRELQARLGVPLGETSADGEITIEAVYCLGLCACAPAAMLDGKPIGRLDGEAVEAIVAEVRA